MLRAFTLDKHRMNKVAVKRKWLLLIILGNQRKHVTTRCKSRYIFQLRELSVFRIRTELNHLKYNSEWTYNVCKRSTSTFLLCAKCPLQWNLVGYLFGDYNLFGSGIESNDVINFINKWFISQLAFYGVLLQKISSEIGGVIQCKNA